MRPGITLAMIVKNEGAKLPRCLKSVKGVVDAIHIVDTGSSDRTIEIAHSFGAKVRQIEWPGAFDVARNESIKEIETEWILYLDADEWLPEGSAQKIRQAIQTEDAFSLLLLVQEVGPQGVYHQSPAARLWRSEPPISFVGVIHEHLDPEQLTAVGSHLKEYTTDIAVYHDGYSDGHTEAKHRRAVELIKKELEIRPNQLYYEVRLGASLSLLHDPEANQVWERLIERILREADTDEPDQAYISCFGPLFAAIPDGELSSAKTDALLRIASGWFPDVPSVIWQVAQMEVRRGKLSAALYYLLDLEKMYESGEFNRTAGFDVNILGKALWTNLGIVAHQLGRKDVAKRNYERVLRLDPQNTIIRQNLMLL